MPIKAIFINSEKREVSFVEVELNSLHKVKEFIGNDCHRVEAARFLPNNTVVYADEEGMFNGATYGVRIDKAFPIIGNAMIVGGDELGNSADVDITLEQANSIILGWMDEVEVDGYLSSF